MTQKILKVGTSLAVTIPRIIQRELGVRLGDFVETDFDRDAGAFVVKKEFRGEKTRRSDRITKLTLSFIDRYRKDLEALRDK